MSYKTTGGRGRPKMPESYKRSRPVQVRFTEYQKITLEKLAIAKSKPGNIVPVSRIIYDLVIDYLNTLAGTAPELKVRDVNKNVAAKAQQSPVHNELLSKTKRSAQKLDLERPRKNLTDELLCPLSTTNR